MIDELPQTIAEEILDMPGDAFDAPNINFEGATVLKPFWVETPEVTLKDVAGIPDIKQRLEAAWLSPIRKSLARHAKISATGLLLYGPPGCGKGLMARAIAGELNANLISIGLTDILDIWLGKTERDLQTIFAAAHEHHPCVVFFDDIETLGQITKQVRDRSGRGLIDQLIEEMKNSSDIVFAAAAGYPWNVDPSLRLPAAFGRAMLIPPPDALAREAILRNRLAGFPQEEIAFEQLAAATEGYSGADLVDACKTLIDITKEYPSHSFVICQNDVTDALQEIAPIVSAWIGEAREHVKSAHEDEGFHDLTTYLRSQ